MNSQENDMLEKILSSLNRIENQLRDIKDHIERSSGNESSDGGQSIPGTLDIITVLQGLDPNLFPTVKALFEVPGCSADEISRKTGRSRSRENQHLNRLVELKYVSKFREGREVRYKLIEGQT
ncbi:MAG TPA: helix-turn-helix domain-containing protein [Candidatus Hodarchaeales archaeon]|nr:helix-turn-helix domain-containing protein [Candidatus Hodarchaeales archaeon]